MKKRTAIIGALVSLLPLGQQLVIGIGAALTSGVVMLFVPTKAQADSASYYYNRGVNKGNSRDYYGAISDFRKSIEIEPNNPKSYASICGMKVQIGMNEEAVDHCYTALKVSKSNQFSLSTKNRAMTYSNICGAKLNLQEYTQTIKVCGQALDIDAQNANAYYNRGSAKVALNNSYGAIFDFNKAIDIDKTSHYVMYFYINRGIAKQNLGDMKGACADWREASYRGNQDAAQWIRNEC